MITLVWLLSLHAAMSRLGCTMLAVYKFVVHRVALILSLSGLLVKAGSVTLSRTGFPRLL
jgi:hypothetical protein